jgi:hypothetical protein
MQSIIKRAGTARLWRAAILTACSCVLAQAGALFDFEANTVGTSTAFTDTNNGISATFSSSGDPSGFVVLTPNIFQTLTGNVLGDPGQGGSNLSLTIDFSTNIQAVALNFATDEFGVPSPLTLTAYEGNALAGSVSASGQYLMFFPEGEIAYEGLFNRVVLSTSAPDFAIDNVQAAAAPEPSSELLLGLGLIALGIAVMRRKATYKFLAAATALSVACLAQAQSLKPILPLMPPTVSTVPANGDVNPYGVAFVPTSVPADGLLRPRDILVSNFNNNQNLQGTGTTIVRITAGGQQSLFYHSATPAGLTAALAVLANGIVIVGNMPTADGTSATVQAGSLIMVDRSGVLIGGIASPSLVNGPWGMALHDSGTGSAQVFFSNVLSGTVVRLDVQYSGSRTIAVSNSVTVASGYNHRGDPAALELGPSGLAYDPSHDVLYVASSADSLVYAVAGVGAATSSQGVGTVFYNDRVHLHGPLDLVIAPNGHLIVANSDGSNVDPNQPSELVEFTTAGQFVGQYSVDANNGGAFGLGVFTLGWGSYQLAAVDDNANILRIWTGSIL